jgi:membrane fusion protein, multidrug efflux system
VARWLLAAALLTALFLAGYLPQRQARAALVTGTFEANREAPSVNVIRAKPSKLGKSLTLPASLSGWEQTVLFARANGYVRRWLVDLGDQVTEGQLLAELDTPELDREVEQARAGLAEGQASLTEAKASRDYSRANLERYESLVPAGVASHAELQKAQAEARVSEAKVGVAEAARASRIANLHRLEQLKSFARVSAPFASVVTARRVDRGSLVSAGSSALFELAVVEPLRVTINVPQSVALGVQPGVLGSLRVRELPGRSFPAKIARTSRALEPTSRTLRVELEVPNPEQQLLPGMFAEVSLELARKHTTLALPASTIIGGKDGLRVAVVDPSGVVQLKPVVLERDNGSEVEVATGISSDDQVVVSPRPFLSAGDRVKAIAAP